MRCPKCGTENAAGKIVCRACGTRLRQAPSTAPVRESDAELRRRVAYDLARILWVMAVVIAAGLGLGFLLR